MNIEPEYVYSQIRIREILKVKYDFMDVIQVYRPTKEIFPLYDEFFCLIDKIVENELKSLSR